jgi:hypothetical protein
MDNNIEQPIATDRECRAWRSLLISLGVITPCKQPVVKKGFATTISTEKSARNLRKNLIDKGLISPMVDANNFSSFCEIKRSHSYVSSEEGEYRPRPVRSDEEYYRRRQVYFRMIQEVLYSRKKLKLVIGKKKDTDPDWYF